MASLTCDFFGKRIKSPLVLASGIVDMTKASLERACNSGAGGVITKSLTPELRKGHAGPNIIDFGCGLMNAMGYPNPGIDFGLKEFSGWKRTKEALIISIVGKDASEFAFLASKVEDAKRELGASAIEAALSCPHTPGYGTMAGQSSPEAVAGITKAIKDACGLPLSIKLSPSSPALGEAAKAAEKAGADMINMGNTVGPGMKIDIHRKMPMIGFGVGGLSGPAIKPIAIRCVYDVYEACTLPIIGIVLVGSGMALVKKNVPRDRAEGLSMSHNPLLLVILLAAILFFGCTAKSPGSAVPSAQSKTENPRGKCEIV
jgi:dihydroorotate dehydrogenase (NAD+) catalytic subunit